MITRLHHRLTRRRQALFALCLSATLTSCSALCWQQQPPTHSTEASMPPDDAVFFQIEPETHSPHACSPTPPDDEHWTGLLIASPQRATFRADQAPRADGAFVLAPICGSFRVTVPSPANTEAMQLIARDLHSGQTFAAPLLNLDASPQAEPPDTSPPPATQLEGMKVTGYFNHNLAAHLPLPQKTASYAVEVHWRGLVSNVTTIDIVEQAN